MVENIFNALNDQEKTTLSKVGTVGMSVLQYFWKRSKHGSAKDEISKSGFSKKISEAIQERFKEKNQ